MRLGLFKSHSNYKAKKSHPNIEYTKLRWDKDNKSAYFYLILDMLSSCQKNEIINRCLDNDVNSVKLGVEQLYKFITVSLRTAVHETIPHVKANLYKSWWDDELTDAKVASV